MVYDHKNTFDPSKVKEKANVVEVKTPKKYLIETKAAVKQLLEDHVYESLTPNDVDHWVKNEWVEFEEESSNSSSENQNGEFEEKK